MKKKMLVVLIPLLLVATVVSMNISVKGKDELERIGTAFGSSLGSKNWDQGADLNSDGTINVFDLALAGKNIAKTSNKTIEVDKDGGSLTGSGPTIVSIEPNMTFIGSTKKNFTIAAEIENANETNAWQFKITWNSTVLNITGIAEGPFLSQNGAYDTSLAIEEVIHAIKINYTEGWALIPNTLLEIPPTYPSGNGTLLMMNFTVVGPGTSVLELHDVILIYSDGVTEYPYDELHNGNFVLLPGDINRDGIVNVFDLYLHGKAFGSVPVSNKEADFNNDGQVNATDLAVITDHYGEKG